MDTSAKSDGSIYLSVVTPAYNEAENLSRLFSEIATALSTLDQPWEIICVDDGSVDDTLGLVLELMKKHPQLRVVSLQNRSGQTAALDAGLRRARGTFIATLDADLQNDPADIPRLLEVLLSKQCGLVNGWRTHRRDPWVRLVSTRFANNAWKWLMHERVHDSGCGLKVFRRECIDRLKLFNGMNRFLPALVVHDSCTWG